MSGITMTMVARDCGVSVSTVSHVINGTRPVAARTRTAVLESMDRLGFVHRPAARSLAAGGTTTVGIAMSSLANPFWHELIEGFHTEARRQDIQLLVVDTAEDPHREQRVVANLLAHHVGGLILSPSVGWEDTTLRLLKEHPIPYVIVDRLGDYPVDQVGVENEVGTSALVSHLISLGHQRIAAVTGLRGLSTSRERYAGFVRAHARAGLQIDPALVVSGRSSEEGGLRAMRAVLALEPRPTAVFSANSSMSVGVIRAINEAGLEIPRDIALVCFDDFPWADAFSPHVTAVAQPCYAIGARAVQMLMRRIENSDRPLQSLRLSGEIIHRTSCGCDGSTDLM